MIRMSQIQRYICPSCASDDEFIELFDSVERVDEEIIKIIDKDEEMILIVDQRAQHKQDDDDDVEIQCYI